MTDNTRCACPCHQGKTIMHIRPCCEPAWPQNVADIYGTPTTQPTDNSGLIDRAREAAARYFENDHIDKARKAVAVLIRKGGTMDDQDATQIALYALAEADRQYAAALATKDAEIAAAYEAFERYAWHDTDCLSRKGAHYGEESCDCGFAAALGAKP